MIPGDNDARFILYAAACLAILVAYIALARFFILRWEKVSQSRIGAAGLLLVVGTTLAAWFISLLAFSDQLSRIDRIAWVGIGDLLPLLAFMCIGAIAIAIVAAVTFRLCLGKNFPAIKLAVAMAIFGVAMGMFHASLKSRMIQLKYRTIVAADAATLGRGLQMYCSQYSLPPADLRQLIAAKQITMRYLLHPLSDNADAYFKDKDRYAGPIDWEYVAWRANMPDDFIVAWQSPQWDKGEGAAVVYKSGKAYWLSSGELADKINQVRRWIAENQVH